MLIYNISDKSLTRMKITWKLLNEPQAQNLFNYLKFAAIKEPVVKSIKKVLVNILTLEMSLVLMRLQRQRMYILT